DAAFFSQSVVPRGVPRAFQAFFGCHHKGLADRNVLRIASDCPRFETTNWICHSENIEALSTLSLAVAQIVNVFQEALNEGFLRRPLHLVVKQVSNFCNELFTGCAWREK